MVINVKRINACEVRLLLIQTHVKVLVNEIVRCLNVSVVCKLKDGSLRKMCIFQTAVIINSMTSGELTSWISIMEYLSLNYDNSIHYYKAVLKNKQELCIESSYWSYLFWYSISLTISEMNQVPAHCKRVLLKRALLQYMSLSPSY